jgi:hypothetical protein
MGWIYVFDTTTTGVLIFGFRHNDTLHNLCYQYLINSNRTPVFCGAKVNRVQIGAVAHLGTCIRLGVVAAALACHEWLTS